MNQTTQPTRRLFATGRACPCRPRWAVAPGAARAQASAASGLASFKTIKQIKAGDLDVGYVDEGPATGPVVILLHGWPYDINSFVDVAPILVKAGYRVIIPHLRGFGTTRLHQSQSPAQWRTGRPGRRCHRPDGCAENRQSYAGRLRLGRPYRRRGGRLVAATR